MHCKPSELPTLYHNYHLSSDNLTREDNLVLLWLQPSERAVCLIPRKGTVLACLLRCQPTSTYPPAPVIFYRMPLNLPYQCSPVTVFPCCFVFYTLLAFYRLACTHLSCAPGNSCLTNYVGRLLFFYLWAPLFKNPPSQCTFFHTVMAFHFF